jgi:hypothetical protein
VALLAAALPVALAGDGGDPTAGLAEPAGGQTQVDAGEHVLHALGVVLDAPCVQEHPGAGCAPDLGGLLDARLRHAGDLLAPGQRVVGHGGGGLLEAVGVVADEVVIEPVALDQHVEDGAHQRRVGARLQAEEHIGGASDGGDPGIGHDQLGAAVTCSPDVAGGDRRALGNVGASHEDHIGERDVAPRVRSPVDPQGLHVALPRRHHAEPAVVIEVGGADAEAGELAHEVGLLVAERHAGEHGEAVGPVLGLDAPDLSRHAVERLVPGGDAEPARGRRITLERFEEAVGVGVLQVALDALGAELALVEREVVPGLEAHHLVVGDLQDDPALLAAEAAVGLHLAVDLDAGVPAALRRGVQMRPVLGDQRLFGHRGGCHQPNPPTRWDWARVTRRRRQGGQVSW